MSTARRRLSVLAVAASFAGCGGSAPGRHDVAISAPSDTVVTRYAEVTRAAWLGGDRWAVVAPRDGQVGIIDFGTGSVRRLGGEGSSALRNPATAFTTGDTLYVSDWGLRQTSVWTLDGRLIRSVPAAALIRGALPKARDAAGRYYVELSPGTADAVSHRDSASVVRTAASSGRGDTVARLAPLDVAEVFGDQGRRFERRVFSGTDAWGALADGSVWVARVYHNRVDWRSPDGAWTRGRPLPDRVLEVTRYDREMFVRKFPKELRSTAQHLPFAPVKPPFDDAFGTADGTVWLVKSRAPADSAGRYHVVDRDGRLLRNLRIAGHGRVIGANNNTAIAVEPAPTGVRLLRFTLPPIDGEGTGGS